jgi:hypothetical protein
VNASMMVSRCWRNCSRGAPGSSAWMNVWP